MEEEGSPAFKEKSRQTWKVVPRRGRAGGGSVNSAQTFLLGESKEFRR